MNAKVRELVTSYFFAEVIQNVPQKQAKTLVNLKKVQVYLDLDDVRMMESVKEIEHVASILDV